MAEVPVRREVIVAVDGKDDYSWQVVDWALRTVVREDDLVCVLQVVPCTPQHVEVLHGPVGSSYTLTKEQATELQPSTEDIIYQAAQQQLETHVISKLKAQGVRHAVRGFRDTINASKTNIGEAVVKVVEEEHEFALNRVSTVVVIGGCTPGRKPGCKSDSFAMGTTADYVARNCIYPVIVHRLPGPVIAQSGEKQGKVIQPGEGLVHCSSLKTREFTNNTSVIAPM